MSAAPQKRARLIVSEGGRDRIHELLDDACVIGNGYEADLVLREERASERHCEVRLTADGYRLIDLESRFGTVVNGKATNQHRLANGDSITIGSTTLTFLGASATPAKAAQRPAEPALRSLPTTADGEPKRFYRREGRAKQSNTSALIIGGIFVVGLILVLVLAMSSSDDGAAAEKARARFAHAEALVEENTPTSLNEAIVILEDLDRRAIGFQRVEELLLDARFKQENQADSSERAKERQAHEQLLAFFEREPAPSLAFLETEVQSFASKFPESTHLKDLRKKLRTRLAGGADRVAAWRGAEAAVKQHTEAKAFVKALAALEDFETDGPFMKQYGSSVNVRREIVERSFEQHFEREVEAAREARTNGRRAEALQRLQALAEVPLPSFQLKARRLIDAIEKSG